MEGWGLHANRAQTGAWDSSFGSLRYLDRIALTLWLNQMKPSIKPFMQGMLSGGGGPICLSLSRDCAFPEG